MMQSHSLNTTFIVQTVNIKSIHWVQLVENSLWISGTTASLIPRPFHPSVSHLQC